ncbi:sensor histidine kinase [Nocardioides pantholopis]|uniref:sensor histidine kinase n=1 Tax=Nocardioides pantholopis TaxID=2483798 RepID=UPI0013DE5880|nr:histidine kinase [Nocardioides pantholopis]
MGTSRQESPSHAPYAVAIGCGSLALVALVAVTLIGEAATVVPSPREPAWRLTALGVVAQAVALLWVRSRPRAALIGTALPAPLVALAGAADAASITSLAILVAVYLAASTRPVGALALPLGVVAGAILLSGLIVGDDLGVPPAEALGGSLLQAAGTVGVALLAATWVRALRESKQARAAQGRAVAREQDALVQAAIARERTDMARELHDIAAHHLTGIAVLAAAVERQIDTDPVGAKHAVHQVRDQATLVLRDLRSLVGLLRDQQAAAGSRPETLAGIPDLVTEVAAAGRDVEFTMLGDPDVPGREVGPLAQLAAFRAVQEALSNAARHAPGAASRVSVDARADDAVVVSVRNGPAPGAPSPAPGTGFGLVGMRERADLTNATLEAGSTQDGGWQVTMRVPREGPGEVPGQLTGEVRAAAPDERGAS